MVKKVRKDVQAAAARTTKRPAKPEYSDAEERIFRDATLYLIHKVGGLFVATGLREELHRGRRQWVITVTMRYPTGHEGYVGDLLYNGKEFKMLTEDSVIDERVQQIADDPEGIRKWNEYRASTLRPGKA